MKEKRVSILAIMAAGIVIFIIILIRLIIFDKLGDLSSTLGLILAALAFIYTISLLCFKHKD